MNIEQNSKFILSGPKLPHFLSGYESLGEYIIQKLQNNKNKILLIDGLTSEKLTASELLKKSILVAERLQKYGIKRGDKIGICCENRYEYYYILYGTIFLGATITPYNITYTERELRHAVSLTKPRLIFVSSLSEKIMNNIKIDNSYIQDVIVIQDNQDNVNVRRKTFNDFLKINYAAYNTELNFKCNPENIYENISFILCSSGTTGLPKGVQITQYNLLLTIVQHFERDRPIEMQLCPEPIVLTVIPLFHVYGVIMALSMACYYNTVVFLPKFEDKIFLQCIQQYRVNTALLVPPLMVFLAKSPIVSNYDLSSLKIVWCGAASLKKEIEDTVKDRIGLKIIRQAYGLTEAMICTSQSDFNQKSGSVGALRLGVKGKVICTETGRILGPNQSGELLFQTGTIMKGYVDDEEATNNTIDKDGWIHTGDVGYYDDDGEFFIVERLKELIKYKGFQVAPAEIEGILLQHPDIADAAVIGLPNELAGELPIAFVVRKANVNLTEKEIIDFVANNVSYAKRLHGGVIFIDEIPKNPSGKILRRKLRELLKNFKSKL